MNKTREVLRKIGYVYVSAGAYFMTALLVLFTLFKAIGGYDGVLNNETLGAVVVFSFLMGCDNLIKDIKGLTVPAKDIIHFIAGVLIYIFSFGILYKITAGTGLLFTTIAFAVIYGVVYGIGMAIRAVFKEKTQYKSVFTPKDTE